MLGIFREAFASKKKADDAAATAAFAAAAAAAPPAPAAAPNDAPNNAANATTTEAAADPDAELNDIAAQRLKASKYRAATIKTIEDLMWHITIDTMKQARAPLDHAHNFLSKQRPHNDIVVNGTNMTRLVLGKAMTIFREFEQLLDEGQDSVFEDLPRTDTVQYNLEASPQSKT